MLKKIIFTLENDRYFINLKKNLLIISNREKFTRKIYQLDDVTVGEDWIVLETMLNNDEGLIFDIENVEIEFVYEKEN